MYLSSIIFINHFYYVIALLSCQPGYNGERRLTNSALIFFRTRHGTSYVPIKLHFRGSAEYQFIILPHIFGYSGFNVDRRKNCRLPSFA
jgi:hypothetical protein